MKSDAEIKSLKPQKKTKKSRIGIRVSDDELEKIIALSSSAGLTISDYMRNVALGYKITSKSDLNAILYLYKIGGDQGRLGGLLKKLISQIDAIGEMHKNEVRPLLKKIESAQNQILEAIEKIKKF